MHNHLNQEHHHLLPLTVRAAGLPWLILQGHPKHHLKILWRSTVHLSRDAHCIHCVLLWYKGLQETVKEEPSRLWEWGVGVGELCVLLHYNHHIYRIPCITGTSNYWSLNHWLFFWPLIARYLNRAPDVRKTKENRSFDAGVVTLSPCVHASGDLYS